ncbi:uncharacterized protein PITG_06499 [Phytophthora infestans T30-4]|uniref:DUF6818 domain-containing protein n=1 Tax=Phytophthora infestans (strain T30-4) TaxID=403677 RepID=D0N4Z9_PHYIT|nr:uncharacterized protein PITG_06499 [Phytophthora infestans T30-4]EEY69957.1 conserved hypothetical protein [Phytophthora infestans T30-4]|eukprot:XP_002998604.1 conserved hypothetical protein [Phytophthora infestans T30-4]
MSSKRRSANSSILAQPSPDRPAKKLKTVSSEADSLSPRKTQLEHGAQMKAGRSTPPTSPASTLASMGSPLLTSSQETADAPWSPRTCTPRPVPVSSRPDVPKWFSECFESDGYNTDELILIGPPPPSQRRRTSILSQSSSPGFSVIVQSAGVALNSEWLDVDWPPEVTRLNVQSNPLGLKFPTLSTGIRGDQGCGCEPLADGSAERSTTRLRKLQRSGANAALHRGQTLYGKPKPTGSQGEEVPLRHRPVLMAHEIQAAIELKGGAHTSHDGCDRGEDDEQLLKDVDAATLAARGFNEDEEDVDIESDEMNSETAPNRDVAEDVGNPTGEHQSPSREEDSQEDLSISTAMGTVITSRGTFDMSLANDVWSDENDEDPDSSEETRTLDQDASAELGGSTPKAKGTRNSTDSSSQSGTYTANKRIRAKKRMQLLEKELQDIEAKQSLGGNEMIGLLMFMREESNRRAGLEDKHRREDREERLAVEKAEREERERI